MPLLSPNFDYLSSGRPFYYQHSLLVPSVSLIIWLCSHLDAVHVREHQVYTSCSLQNRRDFFFFFFFFAFFRRARGVKRKSRATERAQRSRVTRAPRSPRACRRSPEKNAKNNACSRAILHATMTLTSEN